MRTPVLIAVIVAAAAPARAELAVPSHRASMTAASDEVCELLKADRHDRCKPLAHVDQATVYQAGTKHGIRRFVLAIDHGDDVLVSPALDLAADDATLDSTTPTVRPIQIDGRPAVVLDVVASFHRGEKRTLTHWQTEAIMACGETASGAFECSTVEVGSCDATVGSDGAIETSCGGHAQLTLVR